MMKRFIPILCALLVLVCCVAVPAFAAEQADYLVSEQILDMASVPVTLDLLPDTTIDNETALADRYRTSFTVDYSLFESALGTTVYVRIGEILTRC